MADTVATPRLTTGRCGLPTRDGGYCGGEHRRTGPLPDDGLVTLACSRDGCDGETVVPRAMLDVDGGAA